MPSVITYHNYHNNGIIQCLRVAIYQSHLEALIVRHIQNKKWISFVFYVKEYFNYYNFGTIAPIQVGFSAQYTSHNEGFNQIEN